MNIRESISNIQPGQKLIVDERYQVNYIRVLAKENGKKLKQEKQSTGEWVLCCIGSYKDATLVYLKRIKAKREWWRRNRRKI